MKNNVVFFVVSVFLLILVSNGVNAQNNNSIGLNAGIVFLDEMDFAKVGVEFNTKMSEHFRFSPSIDAYIASSSCVSINADVDYLINPYDKWQFFPIAGVAYVTDELDLDFNRVGLNLGIGTQYDLSEKIAFNIKAKYQLLDGSDEIVLGIGLLRKF